jgi:hypothetical protein
VKPPSEAKLLRVERELRGLSPGSQRAVGGGVYMRLDASGRRRFMFRRRTAASHPAGTYDSWDEAYDAREEATEVFEGAGDLEGAASVREVRRWTLRKYAEDSWWESVLTECDALTQIDYEYGLQMALAVAGDYTLEQLEKAPLIVDRIKSRLVKLKTFPKGHPREGELAARRPTRRSR